MRRRWLSKLARNVLIVLGGSVHTRTLGQSGIEVSCIGLGSNYVGGHNLYPDVDEAEGVRLVRQAVDAGITFIDTADVYGTGRSEELLGKALVGRRDEVVLATKGGILFGERGSGADNSPQYLRQALHASLQRLGVDSVDLYYIHRFDDVTPVEDSFGELLRFKDEGLIRAAGVSNFELPQLQAAVNTGPVDALQSQYNLLQRQVECDVLPFCAEHGISFIPWGPLAYGLLGGRYDREYVLAQDDWRQRSGLFSPQEQYIRNIERVDALKPIARARSVPLSHVALQWLLNQPAVSSVIAGAKQSQQVLENVQAASLILTGEDLASINAALD